MRIRRDNDQSQIATVIFNYPEQFHLFSENTKTIWQHRDKGKIFNSFSITGMEVLKRRNKQEEPCLQNWTHFDDLLFRKHLENISCRTPYQTSPKPICTTHTEMLRANYQLKYANDKEVPVPCQEMSAITYTFERAIFDYGDNLANLRVSYPNKIKVVTQSKSVNVHSLIGNIGGYIRLFLGSFSIPEISLSITVPYLIKY